MKNLTPTLNGRLARAVAVATALVLALSACTSQLPGPDPMSHAYFSSAGPADFITTQAVEDAGQRAELGQEMGPTRASALLIQDRSIDNGRVTRTVTTHSDEAVPGPGGSVVVADSRGCDTTLTRIDPSGAHHTLIRLAESVIGLQLSPDAREIAFVGYGKCTPCGLYCPAQQLPTVLHVVDLATGSDRRLVSRSVGNPITWSPDSRDLLVQEAGKFRILDRSLANPSSAPTDRAPRGCTYSSPSWTTSGIAVSEQCGSNRPQISLLPGGGHGGVISPVATWTIPSSPACPTVIGTATDFSHERLLVQVTQQEGRCAQEPRSSVVAITGTRVRPITTTSSTLLPRLVG